ncbi:MAG: hypothetical protein GVY02_08955 [Bacteroidetes bacterium]|jgi:hypothetical protein|nr:hypothetical protein [Bacteroidota bacterium]
MNISTDIHSLFVLLLAMFTLGATFLAAYTTANAIRLRNIRLSWRSGKLKGYPLFSTLFLGFAGLVSSIVYSFEISQVYTVLGCYSWMGVCWFMSSYFTNKSYITDHGIVKNINDPSQTIAWHQISDYVEKPSSKGSEYIFIYREPSESIKRTKLIRLELFVPDRNIHKFNKIIDLKIGKTMTPVADSSFDFKAFE